MPLPEIDVARVRRWCADRVPAQARLEVAVECEVSPQHLTIVERRAPWDGDADAEWTSLPVARLRWTAANGTWDLFWRDRHGRFHRHDRVRPTAQVQELLGEIERDPTGIFWG